MNELTFEVTGMTCGRCAAHVQRALATLDGVHGVAVHRARGQAVVTYDPARVSVSAMQEAATNAGYPVRPGS